jgi:ABC-type spermidine/putrescine transport system permease subunit II
MAPSDLTAARRRSRLGRTLLFAACMPILVLLVLPSLIIVPMALTKGDLIQFPPIWISVHSFTDYLGDAAWVSSTLISCKISALAVAIGGFTGSTAAIAMHGRRFPGRNVVSGLILSPIVVPVIVLALGDYLLLAPLRLIGNWAAIAVLHAMLVTPYVFISVQTSLTVGLSTALVRSARSLGAGRLAVFRFVYWPAIRPGVLAGAVLGFAVSFDEVVLSLFMQGATTVTLPVRMFTSIEYDLTPKIAASASLFIALAVLGIVVQGLSIHGRKAP